MIELARARDRATGSDSKIQLVPYEDAYGEGFEELGRRKPDTRAIRELTGWAPTRTIDDAIDDVIAARAGARGRATEDRAVAP